MLLLFPSLRHARLVVDSKVYKWPYLKYTGTDETKNPLKDSKKSITNVSACKEQQWQEPLS